MDANSLILSKNNSSHNDIRNHLERCDLLFKPVLSSYINLEEYSKKLFENATRYEVFGERELVGLVGVYFSKNIGYISNFSLERELLSKGISSNLMKFCLDDFKKQKLNIIRLEVYKENERAIKFYKKYGFIFEKEDAAVLTLVKRI